MGFPYRVNILGPFSVDDNLVLSNISKNLKNFNLIQLNGLRLAWYYLKYNANVEVRTENCNVKGFINETLAIIKYCKNKYQIPKPNVSVLILPHLKVGNSQGGES